MNIKLKPIYNAIQRLIKRDKIDYVLSCGYDDKDLARLSLKAIRYIAFNIENVLDYHDFYFECNRVPYIIEMTVVAEDDEDIITIGLEIRSLDWYIDEMDYDDIEEFYEREEEEGLIDDWREFK